MLLDRFLAQSAARNPQKTALICGARRTSYAEIDGSANALARALLALGVERQDRIAIQYENSVETAIAIYATLRAAGVFMVVNPQVKPDKLAFILSDAKAKVLLTSARNASAVCAALSECDSLRHIVLCGPGSPDDATSRKLESARVSVHRFEDLISAHSTDPPANPNIELDLASLIYTSGSTGQPKGVMLTHLNMVTAVRSITTYLRNEPDDIILSALPLSFDYGLYQVLMAFAFGGTVVLEKQFMYPQSYLELITRERVTGLPIVPTITAILLNLKELATQDFSSIRYVTNTAQALPEHHIRTLRKAMPNARIYSMYGLTECKRVAYLPPELIDRKPTSVGIAIPGTEVWIESENGKVISNPGETGELIVRGAHIMPGYWNRPEESARYLRPGRYPWERELKTGDLFRQDEDGHLYFVSRKDDLIKTAGERVGPREVENVLHEIEAVKEAAVVGVPDDVLGSAIKAFLVLREGASLTEADVIRHCQQRMERFMVPKHVVFRSDLPKTTTGKISKKGLE